MLAAAVLTITGHAAVAIRAPDDGARQQEG